MALDLVGGEGSELLSHVLADRVLECAQCRIHFKEVVWGEGGGREKRRDIKGHKWARPWAVYFQLPSPCQAH